MQTRLTMHAQASASPAGGPTATAWAELVESKTGLRLTSDWEAVFLDRIAAQSEKSGFDSLGEYYKYLSGRGPHSAVEWATLMEQLTVSETWFFRHPPSLRLIRDEVTRLCLARNVESEAIQIWSVGCASGEEAFSLAMVADGVLSKYQKNRFLAVTGTDINDKALTVARKAYYPGHRMYGVGEKYRRRYLIAQLDGGYRVRAGIRRRVCFTRFNVLDDSPGPWGGQDMVYCQNMLIYFAPARRHAILNRLADYVKPGGVLISSPGEAGGWQHDQFVPMQRPHVLAFRRRGLSDDRRQA